jgi:hypothetical protein
MPPGRSVPSQATEKPVRILPLLALRPQPVHLCSAQVPALPGCLALSWECGYPARVVRRPHWPRCRDTLDEPLGITAFSFGMGREVAKEPILFIVNAGGEKEGIRWSVIRGAGAES